MKDKEQMIELMKQVLVGKEFGVEGNYKGWIESWAWDVWGDKWLCTLEGTGPEVDPEKASRGEGNMRPLEGRTPKTNESSA